MKNLAIPAIALLALTACARVDPIDANVVEEVTPPAAINDFGNEVAEEGQSLADMRWIIEGESAMFGPPESEAVLSIACEGDTLGISRYAEADTGAGTLTFSASRALASVAVAAEETPLGQRFNASLAPGDIANDVVEVFSADSPIDVTMTGAAPLIVPANRDVVSLIRNCVGGEESPTGPAATNQVG